MASGECGREIWEFNTAEHKQRFQTLAQNYKLDDFDSYDHHDDSMMSTMIMLFIKTKGVCVRRKPSPGLHQLIPLL